MKKFLSILCMICCLGMLLATPALAVTPSNTNADGLILSQTFLQEAQDFDDLDANFLSYIN